MEDSQTPKGRGKTVLFSILMLAFAGWEFRDGLYTLRTGKPVMIQMHPASALESFGMGAVAAVIALGLIGVALGYLKSSRP
jgi:hypothetical protein